MTFDSAFEPKMKTTMPSFIKAVFILIYIQYHFESASFATRTSSHFQDQHKLLVTDNNTFGSKDLVRDDTTKLLYQDAAYKHGKTTPKKPFKGGQKHANSIVPYKAYIDDHVHVDTLGNIPASNSNVTDKHYFRNESLKLPLSKLEPWERNKTGVWRQENWVERNVSSNQMFDVEENACNLSIVNQKLFTTQILKHNYNFAYLKLNFIDLNVSETKYVIDHTNWIWTFRGDGGGYQYLYLPNDFGYLSFGLLWAHTSSEPLDLKVEHSGNCSRLKVGVNYTDKLIGYALGNLTKELTYRRDSYNSSYWCYIRRVWLQSRALYLMCQNTVCTFQTFEYVCCKFVIDFYTKARDVICMNTDYHFSRLWWMLPVIVGETFFAFYPLFLVSFGYKVRKFSRRMALHQRLSHIRWQLSHDRNMTRVEVRSDEEADGSDENNSTNSHRNDAYIRLRQTSPITLMSTVCSPVFHINFNDNRVSRLLRLLVIFLPMILSTTRVCLDYRYAKTLVEKAVDKGGLVGFTSIIAGYRASRYNFMYFIGGPYVAIGIYIVFGSIFILVPTSLENLLEKGLFIARKRGHFILTMSLSEKEKLGRVFVRETSGYKRIKRYFLAHIYMLLHWRFWRQVFKLFVHRVKREGFPWLRRKLRSTTLALVLCIIFGPVYIGFCVIELVFSALFCAFPVISCFFIVMKAYVLPFWEFFHNRSCVAKAVRNIVFLPFVGLLCITWYIYCVIFFDGFWFISKILMFTYSGIIAYPKLSYGYIILSFMALYYLVESCNKFGESYKELLKISIDACIKIENKYFEDPEPVKILRNRSMPMFLYYFIVERHAPRRVKVLTCMLKFVLIVLILMVSIELLIRFDQIQELSLVSHVFTVLFICALPKIVKVMCVANHQYRARKKMLKRIQKTIETLIRIERRRSSNSDNDSVRLIPMFGYGTFDNEESINADTEHFGMAGVVE